MNLRDQLQSIHDKHGRLTPALVLDEARDPQSPLHSRFEWDDTVAGEKWRQHQAHELIVSVRVTYSMPDGEKRELRQFPAIRRESGYVYEPLENVVEDAVMTKILMADMQREWQQLKRRYDHFEEFRRMIRRDMGEAAA